jgi:hypothetical protein
MSLVIDMQVDAKLYEGKGQAPLLTLQGLQWQ